MKEIAKPVQTPVMRLRELAFLLPAVPRREAVIRWLAFGTLASALWVTVFGLGHRGNLAWGKPIRASGPCRTQPENAWFSIRPARLVDGKKWRAFDGCVDSMQEPWIAVDLQQTSLLREIVVTGRRDCCWNYKDLPLVLEISADDQRFYEVARRNVPISDRDPWRVPLSMERARYVRFRVSARSPAAIALSEIEVFGEPMR